MNIYENSYPELKKHYDEVLNLDKTTYKNSNDEPTPMGCVEEMLSKIPESFWMNDKIKILDPCSGNGNFHLYSWKKLNERFSSEQIVKNNLFFNDINLDRIKNVFSIYGEQSNITQVDFLKYEEQTKYDLIYANPPFAKFTDENKRSSKNHTLVRDFLSKALNLLKEGGYLIFIMPNNWMSLADRNVVIKEITQKQIVYLNVHGAKRWFPKIGSSFTWIVLQNSQTTNPYPVDSFYKKQIFSSNVSSSKRNFIPLVWTKEVESIFKKTIEADNKKFNIETTSDLHKYTKRDLISSERTEQHTHRLIHTPSQTVWSSRPHKFQDGYKVFISTTNKYSTFVDNCGMTQSIAFIRCDTEIEARRYKKILDHDLYKFINNLCRWGNFNNIRILQKFPFPKDIDKIYESFDISQSEIRFIEKLLNQENK
jgi:SAM-dependent methyltransferase/CRISPR/Cas system CMR-associated protein Cmr5 small subunit